MGQGGMPEPTDGSVVGDEPDLKCICIEVRNAAQTLTKLYDRELAPAGLTVTQLSQLNQIRELGQPTLSELARAMRLDRSTLGRNLRLMEAEGLVTLRPGRDGRTRLVGLTDKGRRALRSGAVLWRGVQERLSNRLGTARRGLLTDLLNELTTEEFDHG